MTEKRKQGILVSKPYCGTCGEKHLLSHRELEVLRLCAAGDTSTDIARALHITPRTASTHVQNILLKLGVHNKTHAVVIAWKLGELDL
jgi:DNA-binding CsgD family transcriptional regulator